MVPNAGLWTDYCRQVIRTIQGFRAGALEKVVPAFEGIAEEAERATEAEYERLGGAMPYDDQIDMSDVAEMANDHGIAYYETMSGVRSGPRNLDSGLSEILIVFQAAVPKLVASKYTTSGVRRPSAL